MPGRCCILLLSLAAFGAGGCANRFTDTLPYWPWDTERTSYLTPNKRIEQLRTRAEAAAAHPKADQETLANELAQQIQKEEDPVIREEIVRAIGLLSTDTSRAVVRAAMKDSEPAIRVVACELLAEQGDPDVGNALAETLQSDTDIDVRMAAARGLRKFKDPATVPALGMALDDPDPALQYRAVQSLKEATGENIGDDVGAWRQYVRGEKPSSPNQPSLAEQIGKLRPF